MHTGQAPHSTLCPHVQLHKQGLNDTCKIILIIRLLHTGVSSGEMRAHATPRVALLHA